MSAKLETKPAFTVVGLLLHTQPMTPEIPALWEQFVPRMDEIDHVAEPHVSYGLMAYDPSAPTPLTYMTGLAVERVDELPAGMSRWDVPANTYAVFQTTLPAIGDTFNHIYNSWLPTSGYRQTAGPYFERYPETFSPTNPTLSIYIPVEKSAS